MGQIDHIKHFQVATHAPLMMAVPGKTDSGLRSSQLVEFVDIFPTIAEAAGLPTLETCPDPSNSSHVCTGKYQNPNSLYIFKIQNGLVKIPNSLVLSLSTPPRFERVSIKIARFKIHTTSIGFQDPK